MFMLSLVFLFVFFEISFLLPEKLHGFIGPYHPYNGLTWPAEGIAPNTSVYDAFKFGISAIYSKPSAGNWVFADNVKFHCYTAKTNLILGMLSPPTEGGVVNNPNDTDIWAPLSKPGLIQSAHRFSEIAKVCPEIMGVTIDDFLGNYDSKRITIDNVKDIKAALQGKPVDPVTGEVDHTGEATTPWLLLFICFYSIQIEKFNDPELVSLIDGVNFWIFDQDHLYQNFDSYLVELMDKKLPGKLVITGGYIKNSHYGFMDPKGLSEIIEKSIDFYDAKNQHMICGMFIFAGCFMSTDEISEKQWNLYQIPHLLDTVYYPWLGKVSGEIVDAKTKKYLDQVDVMVYYNKNVLAAHKETDENGKFNFAGWSGKSSSANVIVVANKAKYQMQNTTVKIDPQTEVKISIELNPL